MSIEQARALVLSSASVVGFTGAGISTESGIPDFRSPNGIWARNRTIYFEEFVNNREDRIEYWRQKLEGWPQIREAQPNKGPVAFSDLHSQGKLPAMITQNIDGLHQKAGLPSESVYELHGTTIDIKCLSCDYQEHSDVACKRVEAGNLAPECPECGGLLKPGTISFGQPLPMNGCEGAARAAQAGDRFLVVGSTLVVYPAANLPEIAKQAGAKLVILNRDPTPLDRIADVVIRGEIGEVLPAMVSASE